MSWNIRIIIPLSPSNWTQFFDDFLISVFQTMVNFWLAKLFVIMRLLCRVDTLYLDHPRPIQVVYKNKWWIFPACPPPEKWWFYVIFPSWILLRFSSFLHMFWLQNRKQRPLWPSSRPPQSWFRGRGTCPPWGAPDPSWWSWVVQEIPARHGISIFVKTFWQHWLGKSSKTMNGFQWLYLGFLRRGSVG